MRPQSVTQPSDHADHSAFPFQSEARKGQRNDHKACEVNEHVQPGKLEPVLPQDVFMCRVAVGDKPRYEKQGLDRQYIDEFGMAGHE